eukprot:1155124-Pelagomonas_calceolata.AAC.10
MQTASKFQGTHRPGQQFEVAQRQHAILCNLIIAEAVTLQTILLGVGGTCHRENTLNQFEQLGLDHQHAMKLARKLHAHSVEYALKLVTTRRAIENRTLLTARFWSQVLPVTLQDPINTFVLKLCGGGDSRLFGANVLPETLQIPTALFVPALWWRGLMVPLSQGKQRKGLHITELSFKGRLAEARMVPVTKPVRSGENVQNNELITAFQAC